MATRFYLPSTGTPGISPAFNATVWANSTANADRRTMVTTRISSAMTNKDSATNVADGNQLLRQYISAALGAQTLTGDVKGVMRAIQNGFGFGLAFRVAKCNSDGSTITEILSIRTPSGDVSGDITPPEFSAVTLTNRRLESNTPNEFVHTLTSTAINAGDFLLVEIGVNKATVNDTRVGTINFGDDSGTDLPEDETTTTANNPWVEFSADISFSGGGPPALTVNLGEPVIGGSIF